MENLKKIYEKISSAGKITIDSRDVKEGGVFFALKGENFDGNRYAEDAINKGCKLAFVDDEQYVKDERYILVENVLKTLQQLAHHHRKIHETKILAITGSNGKTTTKELVFKVLSKKYKTLTNEKNFNNHIGVPLTLLNLKPEHEIAIVEMGANHPGEIKTLCNIAEPDYGLITNIGKAHLEGFGSFEGVKRTKAELYDFICNNQGTIFYNSDNELLSNLAASRSCNKISYGTENKANYSGKLTELNPFIRLEFSGLTASTQLIGAYNFENILAAVGIGKYFKVPDDRIKNALENYKPENNRSQVIETEKNKIILDAYNANPTSMKAAIESFSQTNVQGKVLILGDMFELGEYSKKEHKTLVDYLKNYAFEKVFLIGPMFSSLSQKNYKKFKSTEEYLEYLNKNPLNQKTILIKGSRGMALEKAVQYL